MLNKEITVLLEEYGAYISAASERIEAVMLKR